MNEESLKKLKDQKEILEDWLKKARIIQEYIPYVQHSLDVTNWKIDTINQLPVNIENMSCCHNINNIIDKENDFLKSNLPSFHISPTYHAGLTTSMIVSGTPEFISTIKHVSDSSIEVSNEYYQERLKEYRKIQDKVDLIKKVEKLISIFNKDYLIKLYGKIINSFYGVKAGTVTISTASMDIRTFLDKFKGELFAHAKKSQNKKIKNWSIMCDILAPDEISKRTLIQQFDERQKIIDILSDLGKERRNTTIDEFEQVWSRILDHIYVTITTILKKIA